MIELKALSAGYGAKQVLHRVSATLERGSLTCVIGPNGCGKSTLLKATAGILPCTEGDVLIDGTALSALKRNEIARSISYLSQGRALPDMTVEQLVLHGRFPYLCYPRRYTRQDREIARSAIDRMGILPLSDQPLGRLSGGMRQTAYVAMALAQDTDYILLDEPTTYLDIRHQLDLMRILRRLADEGKGVVAVLHDLPLALTFSDRLVVMREGQILTVDTPRGICESGIIEEVFGVTVTGTPSDGGYRYQYRTEK